MIQVDNATEAIRGRPQATIGDGSLIANAATTANAINDKPDFQVAIIDAKIGRFARCIAKTNLSIAFICSLLTALIALPTEVEHFVIGVGVGVGASFCALVVLAYEMKERAPNVKVTCNRARRHVRRAPRFRLSG